MNSLAEDMLGEVQVRASSQEGMKHFVHVLLAGLPPPERDYLVRLQAYIATKRKFHRDRGRWMRYIDGHNAWQPEMMDYVSREQVKHARCEYKQLEQELINEIGRGKVREMKRFHGRLWSEPFLFLARHRT
jgi:hypothetical protein